MSLQMSTYFRHESKMFQVSGKALSLSTTSNNPTFVWTLGKCNIYGLSRFMQLGLLQNQWIWITNNQGLGVLIKKSDLIKCKVLNQIHRRTCSFKLIIVLQLFLWGYPIGKRNTILNYTLHNHRVYGFELMTSSYMLHSLEATFPFSNN